MKLIELFEYNLTEFVKLDTTQYGAWINADTKEIIYVDEVDHIPTMMEIMFDNGVKFPEELDIFTYEHANKIYNWAYDHHYVRLLFTDNSLLISGEINDIKRLKHILLPAALNSLTVAVDLLRGSMRLHLPEDKEKLRKLFEDCIIEDKCKKRKDGKCDQRSKEKDKNITRGFGYPFYGLWRHIPDDETDMDSQDDGESSTDGNSGDVIATPAGPGGTVMTEAEEVELQLPPYLKDQYEPFRYSEKAAKLFDDKFDRRDDNPVVNRGLDKYTLEWITSNPNTSTAYYREILPLSPQKIAKIEGLSGEHHYIDDPDHKERISDLAQSMRDEGFDKKHAILVHVTKNGPKIVEGNHRVRAAIEAGLGVMPVEWRWLGGTEMNRKYHPIQYARFRNDSA